jgi:hypothetical protein
MLLPERTQRREGKDGEATYQAVGPRDRKAPRCNRPLTDGTADGQSGGSASSGSVTWGWAGLVTCLSRGRGQKLGGGKVLLSGRRPTAITNGSLDKTQGVLACLLVSVLRRCPFRRSGGALEWLREEGVDRGTPSAPPLAPAGQYLRRQAKTDYGSKVPELRVHRTRRLKNILI